MDYLKSVSLPDSRCLIEYFDSVYVNGPLKRIGNDENYIQFRQLPPKFPPPTWNMCIKLLSDSSRSKNICEGWNNRFNHLVCHKNPTILKLIKKYLQN